VRVVVLDESCHLPNTLQADAVDLVYLLTDHGRHEFRTLHRITSMPATVERDDLQAAFRRCRRGAAAGRSETDHEEIGGERAHTAAQASPGPAADLAPSFIEQQACSWT
jgi:hypothetical protein